ncbi:MAG: molybdopterin-dependent oxidoreductase [Deltaproteobacteria bacterium]|nr:molybdopterin-dependent oxidoreductase [Deltaproteobacteria bacterium]
MGAATVAAARLSLGKEGLAQAAPTEGDGLTWSKAPCRFCGTGCHVQVGVKGGKVVSIQGDAKAEVNKGLLCVKGYHVGLALYGKDRLTKPLLRKNGKLEPISWDEAIEIIAKRAMKNPAGFAIYGSGQWTIPEGYAANKIIKAGLATNQIDPNARLCMASAVTGFLSTYGVDEPAGCYDDLDRADVVILWGNNPAEMHPVLFSRIVDRRSKGENVVVIDLGTRKTRSSGFCQHVFTMKPHGDLAIALGIMHLLVESGTYDKEFVEKYCNFRQRTDPPTLDGKAMTFEEFKASLKEYTPEKVQQLSGVAAKDIRLLAGLFGKKDLRITSLWCMGMNQHTRGTAINDLVHGVHLLSGHFGKPGDAPTSLTGQPSACGTVREVGTLAHGLPGGLVVAKDEHRKEAEAIWNLPAGRINAKPGYHTVDMWKRFSTPKSKGGDIDTIWVQVTNPAQSLPNVNALVEPSRKDPDKFLIVSDVYPTRTAMIADLVLPSAMWVEKNGMVGNSERRTQQWFKMVPPPGDARDDCWQLIAVAHKLLELGHPGMKDKDGKWLFHTEKDGKEVPIWDWKHYYDVNVDERLFEEYRKFSRFKHKDLAPYQEYVKARGMRWPVVQQKDGTWRETKFRFSKFDDPYVTKGDVQFYHSVTKDDRALIWFHPYEAPPEVPDADYPFWLCTGRVIEHWHTGSITMRIPQLHGAMPQAYVELHRDDAKALGVQNGEIVVLESRRGSVELPAWIDGRGQPPPGSVFVPFFDETILVNKVTLEAHDPLSKQPDYKKCAVRVKKKPPKVAAVGKG